MSEAQSNLPERDGAAGSSDLLLYGGRIYTRVDRPPVEAIFISRGRVTATGMLSELEGLARPHTRRLHLAGATALPGLSDSHLHLVALGQKLQKVDLSHARCERELLDAVGRAAHRLPLGAWLEGRGFDESRFPSRSLPTLAELDAVSGGRPVLLGRVCSHAAFANSAALSSVGVTAATPDPPGGRLGRDPLTGALTGILWDSATQLVSRALPAPSDAELEEAISLGMDAALKVGLTSVHTEDLRYIPGVERTHKLYSNVLANRAHSPRVLELVWYTYLDELIAWAGDRSVNRPGFDGSDAAFAFGGVKLMADGALGARSAWLRAPYSDAPGERGLPLLDLAFMRELAVKAARHNWPSAIHAIGDAAAEAAISAIEAVHQRGNEDRRLSRAAPEMCINRTGAMQPAHSFTSLRHRLIHLQVLAPDLLERIRQLPIAADIQPRFVGTDLHWVVERIGDSRLPYSYAWRTLLETGVRCAGGSDAPVEPVSPIEGIHAAVTRQDPSGAPAGGWLPGERLSVSQALSLFTVGPAYAAGEETRAGTLLPGSRADITVLDRDPFAVRPDELKELRVVATLLGGQVAYEGPIRGRP